MSEINFDSFHRVATKFFFALFVIVPVGIVIYCLAPSLHLPMGWKL